MLSRQNRSHTVGRGRRPRTARLFRLGPSALAAAALFAGLLTTGGSGAPGVTPRVAPAAAQAEPATMLGGDPRKDSIYFAMTARFYDGYTGNDRGGNQHAGSGNAANDDPMFRGDFKGLAEKLEYIKGLGFSAIWITPVVLNRSDYDYHGYHGYDFYLVDAYNRYIDMGVDGFRIDTAVHVPRTTWNRRFLSALHEKLVAKYGADKAADFYVFGEVAAFVNDKWNRGSVNHSAQFYTWKERKEYSADDATAALEMYEYEQAQGPAGQPTSQNAFLDGNTYHAPDRTRFSGMNIIDMRMHMNFGDASNAFHNGKDSDDSTNDATYNVVYVDSHDYGPNKSSTRYAGGTDAWAENMSLMWTFRGVPTLLYGSEIEFQAGKRIDCGPTCPLASTGRAYFGDHLEGTVTASDFGVVDSASGEVATTLDKPLARHLQRLNQIRRAVPALQMGQYSTEGVSGDMAFKRRYTSGDTDSFAAVTVTGDATFSGIPDGTYTDVVTGDTRNVTDGTLSVSAPGKGNLRAYVRGGPGRIGTDGPYLK